MEEPEDLPRIISGGLILPVPSPIHPNPIRPLPLYTEQVPMPILVQPMKGGPIRPLNYSSQARPGQPNGNAAIVLPPCPPVAPRTQPFVPRQPPQRRYTAIPPPSTYESPVPKTIEPVECPKDSDDDEEFLAGELSELFYPSQTQPQSIIQALPPIKSEYPLSLPAQDQIISRPVEPTLVVSDDSPSDSSDSETDPDPVQPIMHIFEPEPLIFKNAQFEGAVKPSKLSDLPSHLPKELFLQIPLPYLIQLFYIRPISP
ncbi:hypothetical protein QJS10_CPA10g01480 [Acorus calamus]|uniref:Uncharacterized protein n=1 Tax=Acorus calamus TaxID=4465 RepID=A0AAV9DYB9_ACOCL|nr:hypothetical protein QJS10_CPA10g01480 [Acorus calamus]